MTQTAPRSSIGVLRCLVWLGLLAAMPAIAAAEPPNLRRTHVVRSVFETARDAVVNVNTAKVVRQRFGMRPNDPFFRRFFRGFDRDVRRTSLGSGFIIHAEGYVVTNAHVVDAADEIEVNLADGTTLPAKVLAADARQDLAILKVDPPEGRTLSVVQLGDSSDLLIGEPVVAIGNPLGFEHTVTAGIVSAIGRELPVAEGFSLTGLIQSDTAINPGNSGGPLLNAYGQVIGINTVIRGDAQNIAFAIPVGRLRDLLPQLLSPLLHNRVDAGGELRERRRVEPPSTVVAELSWVQGDAVKQVAAINGRQVGDVVQAAVALLRQGLGETLAIDFADGTQLRRTLAAPPPHDGQRLARQLLGAEVREPTADERRLMRLGREGGVLVLDVTRGGPAAAGGLRRGDVIVQLGPYRLEGLETLAQLLAGVKRAVEVEVYVVRGGQLGRTFIKIDGRGEAL